MTPIPSFPVFRPIELDDRAFFEDMFREMQPEVSEFNFTNLFMFRHVHDYKVTRLFGNVVILARSYIEEPYFLPPLGDKDILKTISMMMDYLCLIEHRPVMDLAWKGFVEKYIEGNDEYNFIADADNSDYLYRAEELRTLTGRKFHDKKNLLNRFIRKYAHEYRTLTPELVPQAMDLVERWCKEKCSMDIPSTYGETEATMLALKNMERLSLTGGVVLIGGHVEALSLGEMLNRDTVVVHVEKANSAYEGLYQFISSEFLSREFPGTMYVNREQDLGEPNLRKSKLSYNPVRMVEKYRVWPRE